jgi:hypothetical protein
MLRAVDVRCEQTSIMNRWGFVLRRTKSTGEVCAVCPWMKHCSGCVIPPSHTVAENPLPPFDGLTIVVDWDPVGAHCC